MFKRQPLPAELTTFGKTSMGGHIGLEFIEVGADYLVGRMPVDERTRQPYGILHGGASVVLAETLGSVAASLCLDPEQEIAVGLEINANHIRSVRSGWVIGRAEKVHIGRQTHVWQITIKDEQEHLVCISRITMAILATKNKTAEHRHP